MSVILGRKVTGEDVGMGTGLAGEQRATKVGAPAKHLWAWKIGGKLGKSGGSNVTYTLGAWLLNGSGNPQALAGKSAAFTVSVAMPDDTAGALYERDLLAAFAINSGEDIAVGGVGTGADWAHGQDLSGAMMYFRSGLSGPADPNGYTAASPEGQLSCYLVCDENVAPDTPTNLSPANGGIATTVTPTFAGDFRDDNETMPNGLAADKLASYQIEVYASNGTTKVWTPAPFSASSTEKTNRRFSRVCGVNLTGGNVYKWRSRVTDMKGASSPWTALQSFTVNGGGLVLCYTPNAKVTILQPSPFSFGYLHANSLACTAVKIRLKQNGQIVQGPSAEIAKAVAAGANSSLTWAESGFTDLSYGGGYSWEMQAKDSTGLWSPWSAGTAFSVNAYPDAPTLVSLIGGAPTSSPPELRFTLTDPDNAAAELSGTVEVLDPGNTARTKAATLLSGDTFKVQLTATECPSYGTYQWRAKGTDTHGLVGAWSAYGTFSYGPGPTVTITAPAAGATVTTHQPNIAWTAAGQVKRRIQLQELVGGVPDGPILSDTGTVTSAVQNYTVPAGPLHDGHSYRAFVDITNSVPLTGSASVDFDVSFIKPDTVTDFTASPEPMRFDPVGFPSGIRCTWTPVSTAIGVFGGYILTREALDGAEPDKSWLIASPTESAFIDPFPTSGRPYLYSIVQLVFQGNLDITESLPATAAASVTLAGVVLADVDDGVNRRVALTYVKGRGARPRLDRTLVETWDEKPVVIDGVNKYWEVAGTYRIGGDPNDPNGPEAYMDVLRSLWGSRPDLSPLVCCYRDERKRKLAMAVMDLPEDDEALGRYEVKISLVEVAWPGGVPV